MTTATQSWTSSITEVAGSNVEVVAGGSGPPLIILPDELGHPGWLRYHDALARNHTLHIPSLPGIGGSDQLDWSMKIHDLAIWYLGALDKLGLEGADLMGFSFGGWLAAELATMCPQQFRRLILVGAGGIRPPQGDIYDIFEVTPPMFIRDSLLDADGTPEYRTVCPAEPEEDILERWENAMETTCRVSWRPYMHDPGLVNQVYRLERLPTLLVWGAQDRIVPVSAGEEYQRRIPGSRLEVIDQCGHHPELEATERFVEVVEGFLRG
ncbi:MAG: alpha/beta hydrolase [Chloroflexi bacterium]|nr:alpha/beta hydrolase [Chloroflexota bacterium]MYD48006.1 alpha/beta hydrolase [Chloroflexota bacterium]